MQKDTLSELYHAEATAADGLLLVYDAWNRLVEVWEDTEVDGTLDDQDDTLVAEYQYDGRHRRIAKIVRTVQDENVTYDRTDYYYSVSWQCLEERTGSHASLGQLSPNPSGARGTAATDVTVQYVWDLRYIDALVCRDRDQDADGDCTETDWTNGNDTDEHLYYCNDANMNVTALVRRGDGTVLERCAYDPYGEVTFLKADWSKTNGPDGNSGTADDGTTSGYGNEILYCGYRFDPETHLYHVRYRSYHPTLGRWMQRDPAGYVDGMGLYEYALSSPWHYLDPGGMKCGECCPPFDEKDNHYIVSYDWAITPGSKGADPGTTDVEKWKESLTPVEVADMVGSVATGAAEGYATGAGKLAKVAEGALGGAIEETTEEVVSGPMKDAAFEGVKKAKREFNRTGNRGAVKAWVKIHYKKCEPCFGYLLFYEALGGDYEWKYYDWPESGWYQCKGWNKPYFDENGLPKPKPVGRVNQEAQFKNRFANAEHANQHKRACIAEAEEEFESSNP